MHTLTISFPDRQALCVFPDVMVDLPQAISELGLEDNRPVLMLIGGKIDKLHLGVTRQAIQAVSKIAEDLNAFMVYGGTDMGMMAEVGQIHWQSHYTFPLIGIVPQELVTWPGGPVNRYFLGMGKQRWQLEPHYSHFILVPGSQPGDVSPWMVDAVTILSKEKQSVTILINDGEVSRKDIQLSMAMSRPVIAMRGTGLLADDFSMKVIRNKLITVIPMNAYHRIIDAVKVALLVEKRIDFS